MSESERKVDIAANVARIQERIACASERRGRSPKDITLVAVSKMVGVDLIRKAIEAGVTDIGENYVQEASTKREFVGGAIRWHMIGHLQRNKAKQAVATFDMIHTIDSLRLAEAVGRRAEAAGRTMSVLLQVNVSGEESKSGVEPDETERLLNSVRELAGIQVEGLMTIGRWDPDPERSRAEFRSLAQLAEQIEALGGVRLRLLSMGMSHDFEIAIEEGANLVRVGTAVFGPRSQ